jgi:hypothetical protein
MLESALGLQECALRFLAAQDAAAVPRGKPDSRSRRKLIPARTQLDGRLGS